MRLTSLSECRRYKKHTITKIILDIDIRRHMYLLIIQADIVAIRAEVESGVTAQPCPVTAMKASSTLECSLNSRQVPSLSPRLRFRPTVAVSTAASTRRLTTARNAGDTGSSVEAAHQGIHPSDLRSTCKCRRCTTLGQ